MYWKNCSEEKPPKDKEILFIDGDGIPYFGKFKSYKSTGDGVILMDTSGETEWTPYSRYDQWLDEDAPDDKTKSLQSQLNQYREALEKIINNCDHEDYGSSHINCPVCIATEALNKQ